jgi:4-carboxymuconolactone decarboxylase
MLRMGDVLRTRTQLPGRFRELIVLTTSAMLGARVEFDFHVPFARNEGLSDAVIEALAVGEEPPFADERERVVHEANVQLLRTAHLTHETREEAIALLGYRGLTELIATVTLYVATAYTTNVARVKLAEDFSADPQRLKDFFAGKPA